MEKKKVNTENISVEEKERRQKLQAVVDKFEEVSMEFGPVAAEELKDRIYKLIVSLDQDFKILSENSFSEFWSNKKKFSKKNKDIPRNDIPRFLKNYNK